MNMDPSFIDLAMPLAPDQIEGEVLTYTRKNLTTCKKSADKPSTRCVRTACSKVVNKLFQTC